jgi:hypothetical protein
MKHPRAALISAVAAIGTVALASVFVQRRDSQEAASESANGNVVAYAVSDRILTIRTEDGDRSFVVPPGTPLHQGVKSMTTADLTGANGCPAKVWYRAVEGQLMARDVRLLCAAGSQASSRPQ